jgi:hypothetical protein
MVANDQSKPDLQLTYHNADDTLVDLSAAELAEVLSGLVELTTDFAKAGLFGDGPPPEVRVLPTRQGSFVVQAILKWMTENPEGTFSIGGGSGAALVQAIRAATKSMRADVEDFEYLDNGNVKVKWQDSTVDDVPEPVWQELSKRKKRRKSALRKLMAPLGDDADSLHVSSPDDEAPESVASFVANREDYGIAAHEEVEESEESDIFTTEAEVRAIDFADGGPWRVKTPQHGERSATVEDEQFLRRINEGLALRKTDIFNLRIREDSVTRNDRTTRTWVVLKVVGHRRGVIE